MSVSYKILMIDDDKDLCRLVKRQLESDVYTVEVRDNGAKGVLYVQSAQVDLILLDVVMPALNGIEAAKAIRHHNPDIPIIFLTSQSDIQTKLEGFKAGADDYIIKPFIIDELKARVEAILRRKKVVNVEKGSNISQIGLFTFNYQSRQLTSATETKSLSIKEAELIKLLMDNKDEFVKRDTILTYIWGKVDDYAANSMDVYLSRVRKLFREDPAIHIENLHGTGFRITIGKA